MKILNLLFVVVFSFLYLGSGKALAIEETCAIDECPRSLKKNLSIFTQVKMGNYIQALNLFAKNKSRHFEVNSKGSGAFFDNSLNKNFYSEVSRIKDEIRSYPDRANRERTKKRKRAIYPEDAIQYLKSVGCSFSAFVEHTGGDISSMLGDLLKGQVKGRAICVDTYYTNGAKPESFCWLRPIDLEKGVYISNGGLNSVYISRDTVCDKISMKNIFSRIIGVLMLKSSGESQWHVATDKVGFSKDFFAMLDPRTSGGSEGSFGETHDLGDRASLKLAGSHAPAWERIPSGISAPYAFPESNFQTFMFEVTLERTDNHVKLFIIR